jgi:exopolysaccharide production protein ExoQ
MPPRLASCLCFAFILWLLRRDTKRASGVSTAIWIPLIWIWIIASKPLAYWLVSGTTAAEVTDVTQGSFFDRNAYLALIILGLIVLAKRGITWNQVFGENRWLWIFSLFCLISVLWSPIPFVALKRWIKDVGTIVMILILLTEQNPTVAIRTVFLRCAYLLVPLSVLFIKYYPDMGKYWNQWTGAGAYNGVTTNKNSLGVLAMMSGLYLLWSIVDIEKRSTWLKTIRSMWPELVVLFMCLWILKIADSATSLGCFIVGTGVFLAAHTRWVRTNLRRLGWWVCGLVLASLFLFAVPDLRRVVAESLGRDVTLTTRTDIWNEVLDLKTNPLVGAGFASVWLTPEGSALAQEEHGLAHSHNGYLETYLNTGLIGVVLLLAVLFAAGRNSIKELSDGAVVGNLFAALFLSGVIYNYTEVTFNNGNIVGFSLWLMATQYRLPDDLRAISTDGALEADEDLKLAHIESTMALHRENPGLSHLDAEDTAVRPA